MALKATIYKAVVNVRSSKILPSGIWMMNSWRS